MSRAASLPLLLALLSLPGCQTVGESDGVPARIAAPDAASRAALREAVDSAIGREVLLADDALTDTDLLSLERRPPPGPEGRLATGRNMDLPVVFRLRLVDGRCILVDSRDGSRRALRDTTCVPLEAPD